MANSEPTIKQEAPSTPVPATTTPATSAAHSEDEELIAQLANLQQMHNQLHHLRTLLPSALIGPARSALSQQDRTDPQAVAEAVMKAARQGSADIREFQKNWHDEKTRQLFKDAAAVDTPQGVDAWMVDYAALVKSGQSNVVSEPSDANQTEQEFDSPDEARVAVNKVVGDKASHIELAPGSGSDSFPVTLILGKLNFTISNEGSPRTYTISSVSSHPIARQISKRLMEQGSDGSGVWKKLDELLETLKHYSDAETSKCAKCNSIVNDNLDYALVRLAEIGKSATGESITEWKAYHDTCAPK